MKIDKSKFKDEGGRYLTQSLFLELGYDTSKAVFTFDGQDKEYKGNTYISLKKLYLDAEDPHEYLFATTNLFDWEHWQRMCNNKELRKHISQWREELEIKLKSIGMQEILRATEDGNFQACKYVADKGWDKKVGRPSKAEQQKKAKIEEKLLDEFADDLKRVGGVVNINDRRS